MDEQQELTIKHLVDRYLQEQMQQMLKTEQKINNNASFIFLDNHTIDMIMMYLFLRSDQQASVKGSATNSESLDIDRLMSENKHAFEEIIQQLKEKNNE
ncbi:hypothetical protein [Ornithinibacillus sp. 179-J 7C1 HS]|uniref:hypothetical protein n=1 Tax=Ornithinibacillus sp. 179-J 7C1 HS TaxID=3142384 RepID=UPI0039A3B7A7